MILGRAVGDGVRVLNGQSPNLERRGGTQGMLLEHEECESTADPFLSSMGNSLGEVTDNAEEAVASPLVLLARSLRLRTIEPRDHRGLYELVTHQDTLFRWQYGGVLPTFDDFVRDLTKPGVLAQFVVVRAGKNLPLGIVNAYRPDLRSGTVYIGEVLAPPLQGTGAGVIAMALFVRYLFTNWNFRKFYMETLSYNLTQFRSVVGTAFEIEGRLKDHYYYQGKYYDMFILAMTREVAERYVCHLLRPARQPAEKSLVRSMASGVVGSDASASGNGGGTSDSDR